MAAKLDKRKYKITVRIEREDAPQDYYVVYCRGHVLPKDLVATAESAVLSAVDALRTVEPK